MVKSTYLHANGLYEYEINAGHMKFGGLSNKEAIDVHAPIIILLHGYLDNANSFVKLLTKLKLINDAYQYLAIDHAGHGNSSHRSEDAHYHLVDYAYDLNRLINVLNISSCVLIGHSLGAIVSSIYASTRPNNLIGLITIESCGPLSESESTTSHQLTECFKSRQKALLPIKQPENFEQVVNARMLVSEFSEEDAITIMQRNVSVDMEGNCEWKTDKRLRTKSTVRMTEAQSINVLENVECNKVVILGENGFEKVKKGILARPTVFQNIELFTFSGGHYVHLDSVNNVADTILDALNKWL